MSLQRVSRETRIYTLDPGNRPAATIRSGDALKVEFISITPWGDAVHLVRPGRGFLEEEFTQPYATVMSIDRGDVVVADRIRIPARRVSRLRGDDPPGTDRVPRATVARMVATLIRSCAAAARCTSQFSYPGHSWRSVIVMRSWVMGRWRVPGPSARLKSRCA